MTKEKTELMTASAVKERGWTDSMIRRLLGEPDDYRPNPRYRKAAPMKLYRLERVEEAEQSSEFAELMAKAALRRKSAQKAVESKRTNLIERVRNAEIEVVRVHDVVGQAIDHYNARQLARGNYSDLASRDSDSAFLKRITYNYIRHCLTNYDEELDSLVGQTGKDDAYWILRNRTFAEISRVYPELEEK